MLEKIKVYYIEASTGCSCCSYEDFIQGFYLNDKEPKAIIEKWQKGDGNPLASQYSKYGNYFLREAEVEIIDDKRVIFNDYIMYVNDKLWFGRERN